MLIMPKIETRRVEPLKYQVSKKVAKPSATSTQTQNQPATPSALAPERRNRRERRTRSIPVAVERRKGDRRNRPKPLHPHLRRLLENSESQEHPQEGRFINESV